MQPSYHTCPVSWTFSMKYSVFFRKLENFWILNFGVQRHQLISGYHLETLIVKPKSKSQSPVLTGPKVGPYPYPQLLTMNQPGPKDWPGGQQEQGHFPRFDLTAFVCDFPYMRPLKYDWESSWYRTGVVGAGLGHLIDTTWPLGPLPRQKVVGSW